MSADHRARHIHEDNRNEAVMRVRVLAEHEHAMRQRTISRLVGVLVQRPEPHHFHEATVRERVSPRRLMDIPDQPGMDDIGGFGWGVIC